MKKIIYNSDITAMSNVRGKDIVNPGKQPFSFYFSARNSSHGIRVKPLFNADKMISSLAGNLELIGDWKYTPGPQDKHISSGDVNDMKKFFKRYIVLFCLVWESKLYETTVSDYFEGKITFDDLIEDLRFYNEYKEELDQIHDVESLYRYCKKNNLVNLYGN